MLDGQQDLLLVPRVLDLVLLYEYIFTYSFHGVQLATVFQLDEEHLAEASFVYDFQDGEIFQTCGMIGSIVFLHFTSEHQDGTTLIFTFGFLLQELRFVELSEISVDAISFILVDHHKFTENILLLLFLIIG